MPGHESLFWRGMLQRRLCLAEAVDITLGDRVTVRIFLGPRHVCPRHGSSAVHNLSFGKQLLRMNVWYIDTR